MIIVKEKESLNKATEILERIFLEQSFSFEKGIDINKWLSWFEKQSTLFKENKISIPKYFAQIARISSFLIDNTSLSEVELFEIEQNDRKRIYDLTEMDSTVSKALSDEEFIELAKTLFRQLKKKSDPNLKTNTRVERLTHEMRNKRFTFRLNSDPEVNIQHIINEDLYKENYDKRNFLLGELFLDLQNTQEAKKHFQKVSVEELQSNGLLNLASLQDDFTSFLKHLKKAFPETYQPKNYGRYNLSFLIGNENHFTYEIEESGRRNVTFVYSTGVIKIRLINIFASFISDNRLSPDGRIGLLVIPGVPEKHFTIDNLIQLDFKQVLGWQDI